MEARESARMLAENYIDYAPRTTAEVRRRLTRAGYEEDVVEAVVEDLTRAGLLDDARFSADWVESRTRTKKLGRMRLASELRGKGVEREEVDRALADVDPDSEVQAAVDLARRKVKQAEIDSWTSPAERAAGKRKLAGFLQRRGYSWEIIEQVFAIIFTNEH